MNASVDLLRAQVRSLLDGERDAIANAANVAAALFHGLGDVNWAGFYFVRGDTLVLGPFQGRPACVRIAAGAGVCGSAWAERRTIVVPDVHAFAGHIACDAASNAEIVVPFCGPAGDVLGVIDVDSPVYGRFDANDQALLEDVAAAFAAGCDW
jgi:GAF domain-containing protein